MSCRVSCWGRTSIFCWAVSSRLLPYFAVPARPLPSPYFAGSSRRLSGGDRYNDIDTGAIVACRLAVVVLLYYGATSHERPLAFRRRRIIISATHGGCRSSGAPPPAAHRPAVAPPAAGRVGGQERTAAAALSISSSAGGGGVINNNAGSSFVAAALVFLLPLAYLLLLLATSSGLFLHPQRPLYPLEDGRAPPAGFPIGLASCMLVRTSVSRDANYQNSFTQYSSRPNSPPRHFPR